MPTLAEGSEQESVPIRLWLKRHIHSGLIEQNDTYFQPILCVGISVIENKFVHEVKELGNLTVTVCYEETLFKVLEKPHYKK